MPDLNFYRPRNARKHIRSIASYAAKNRKRTGLIVLAVVLGVYLLFDNKGVISRVNLEMKKKEMTEKIAAAEQETARLKKQVALLEKDQKTIETIAREKYGMTKKGETMYRVEKKPKE